MIARIWHGWTTPENAKAYEELLQTEILPGIERAHGHSVDLLRKDRESEVEFITVCYFESLDEIKKFAGEDFEVAVVPERARRLLSRFDARSQHYEVKRGR
ncbi:MAG TPA: antibiotic biosynthesis monooxygenase [Terriglobales bacterium]|jgi:hypothetical protein